MKLKEKLCREYVGLDKCDCMECEKNARCYLAGFECARELASDLHKSSRVNDCFTDSDEFLQLGEEEVETK